MLNFALERNLSDPELRSDCSQTLCRTYTRLALWHIMKYHCLDVFGHCGQTHGLVDHLPSWVADWRKEVPHVVFPKLTIHDGLGTEPLFRASGLYHDGLKFNAPLAADTQHLTLCGVKLGEIGNVRPKTNAQTRGVEVEETWRPLDGSRLCPLNKITLDEVFRRTVYTDLRARFNDQLRAIFKRQRGGDFPWPPSDVADLEKDYPDMVSLKRNTIGRCLFYTLASSDDQGLMGLGPLNTKVGDEIWMLKGGKTLYVLRRKAISEAVTYRSLDLLTGGSEEKALVPGDVVYELVGECFILGLMDGEILHMLGDEQRRPLPPPLGTMEKDFRKIGLV
jgi:hypothetical protein